MRVKAGGDAGEIGEVDGEFETRRRTTNMTSETRKGLPMPWRWRASHAVIAPGFGSTLRLG